MDRALLYCHTNDRLDAFLSSCRRALDPGGLLVAEMRNGAYFLGRDDLLDAPTAHSFTWQGSGDVSFELQPKGSKVLLTVIHRRLPDRATMGKVGPGWHAHLDVLVARVSGGEPEPFWDSWLRLKEEYDRRLPA